MTHSWTTAHCVFVFALIAFIIGFVLMLSVIVKRDDQLDCDRANTTRSYLLLLTALVLAVFILVAQRFELAHMVKHLVE